MYMGGNNNGLGFLPIVPLIGAAGALAPLAFLKGSNPGGKDTGYGFPVDAYTDQIFAKEVDIVNLMNAIAELTGGGKVPLPVKDKSQEKTLAAIVPKYVPSATVADIMGGKKALREQGGAYSQTYGKQLATEQQLYNNYVQLVQQKQQAQSQPSSGSATAPVPTTPPPQSNVSQPVVNTAKPPVMQPSVQPYITTPNNPYYPTPIPPSPTIITTPQPSQPTPQYGQQYYPPAYPGATPQPVQASMFDMGTYGPYILGGGALLLFLFMGMDKREAAPSRRRK